MGRVAIFDLVHFYSREMTLVFRIGVSSDTFYQAFLDVWFTHPLFHERGLLTGS